MSGTMYLCYLCRWRPTKQVDDLMELGIDDASMAMEEEAVEQSAAGSPRVCTLQHAVPSGVEAHDQP